uniref:Uncharacterized protein n=1 Tax=Ananas comosus var. bracteatus TaxID=296719 RepID=A0A6V7QLN8_ANACO|nr:unnamed protein product [Ananas comosus var. bracteatus]
MALAHSLSAPSSDPTPTSSSSAMDELIVVERRPHGSAVAVVTINRPGALNSLTRPMMVALAGAFRRLDADDTVAAVVLAGRGRAFCSGVDLTAAEDVFKGDIKDPAADPVAAMVACRKPIVGAIAGFTVTAGFESALACDLLGPLRQVRRPLRCRGRRSSPTLATPAPPLLANFNYPRPSLLADPCARGRVAPRRPKLPEAARLLANPCAAEDVAPRRPLRPRPRRSSPTPAPEAARLFADPCAAEAARSEAACSSPTSVPSRPPAPRPPAPRRPLHRRGHPLRGRPLRGRLLLADLCIAEAACSEAARSSPTSAPPRLPAPRPPALTPPAPRPPSSSSCSSPASPPPHTSSRCISRTASGSLIPHDEDDTAWIDAEFKAGAEQKEATENTLAAYKADQDKVLTELTPTRHARQLFDEMPRIWL